MLAAVINVSEGRDLERIASIAASAGEHCLDVHSDADHHRSVFWLAGPAVESAARDLTATAVDLLDIRAHQGVHPRIGVVDVVPFVPLGGSSIGDAVAARDAFAAWAGDELGLPCFLYGTQRTLPDIRRLAFVHIAPDTGPRSPHPTAGACAVGARGPLVAYNLWLDGHDIATAKAIAAAVRSESVRALGLQVGDAVQVSCNLVNPSVFGPADIYDAVLRHAAVARAELVGLLGRDVLNAVPRERWAELDLGEDRTLEARLERAGLGGSSAPN
jgi:glutamate formiminotransferase / 5-formyltetrahydrofolate cyclo-ligase